MRYCCGSTLVDRLKVLLGALTLLAGCDYGYGSPVPPPMPPPQLDAVTNTMEYQFESSVYHDLLYDRIDDLHDAMRQAFEAAAAITFALPAVTNSVLFPPDNGWPNPDDRDSTYYDGNAGTFYRSFISMNRTTIYEFATYFVTGPRHSLPMCSSGRVVGLTMPNTEMQTEYDYNYSTAFPSAANRGSIVFAKDVEDWAKGCTSYKAQTVQIHILTHEVGHQRAGLTHTDRHTEFHVGQGQTVSPPRYDVMYSDANNTDLRYRVAIFDFEPGGVPATTYTQRTCQDNLFHWRTF